VTRDYASFAVPFVVETPAPPTEAAATTAAPAATGVSINRASIDELAAVKGLSRTVPSAIVKGRPYASLDALIEVRGIGAKTLARLRPALTLD
jgi:DNA uptake protein ComE-like DNA-binding protein